MNMKKIIASVAASALAVSALATSAFAAVSNPNGDAFDQPGKYVYEASKDLGDKLGDCYGVTVNITPANADLPEGIGGGICANNDPFTWVEFGNDGAGKPIVTDGKTITLTSDSALFSKGEESQIIIEGWWGSDFSVDGIVYLGKDGKNLLAADAAPAATEAASTTAAAPADTQAPAAEGNTAPSDKGNADTGVEGVAVVAALAVLAGGAVVVAKKRK